VQKRVLIVEDHEDNALIYLAMLRHAGYEVMIAADGVTGLDAIRSQRPDLVLLDISLPRLSGFDVARQVRCDPAICSTPLVALTAHAYAEAEEQARVIGFDGYLSKPVEPRKVLEEVRVRIGAPIAAGAS
jgi:two-component system, cell cycle response regulator DivK